jgi:hypothetical protein
LILKLELDLETSICSSSTLLPFPIPRIRTAVEDRMRLITFPAFHFFLTGFHSITVIFFIQLPGALTSFLMGFAMTFCFCIPTVTTAALSFTFILAVLPAFSPILFSLILPVYGFCGSVFVISLLFGALHLLVGGFTVYLARHLGL